MSIFVRLLDRLRDRDVTRDWEAEPDHEFVFDLDQMRVAGLQAPDRIDRLSWLGPATFRGFGEYRWPMHGLCVCTGWIRLAPNITHLYLVWRGLENAEVWAEAIGTGYEPFGNRWSFMKDGKAVEVPEHITKANLDELIGHTGEVVAEGAQRMEGDQLFGAEYGGQDVLYELSNDVRPWIPVDASFDENDRLCLMRIS